MILYHGRSTLQSVLGGPLYASSEYYRGVDQAWVELLKPLADLARVDSRPMGLSIALDDLTHVRYKELAQCEVYLYRLTYDPVLWRQIGDEDYLTFAAIAIEESIEVIPFSDWGRHRRLTFHQKR